MALSDRLRRLRKEQGLSQEAVARRADIGLRAYGELERGIAKDPHLTTLEGIASALGTTVAELVGEESEVSAAGKASAPPETGPGERRPSLDQVREVFAPLADGLNHYCARWEEKLPSLQGTAEEVEDFFLDLQDFRAIIMRTLEGELHAVAAALDLGNRYGDNSGLPRDMAVGFTRGTVEEHSLMHEALKRYGAVGHALAESVRDEEEAERMMQALAGAA